MGRKALSWVGMCSVGIVWLGVFLWVCARMWVSCVVERTLVLVGVLICGWGWATTGVGMLLGRGGVPQCSHATQEHTRPHKRRRTTTCTPTSHSIPQLLDDRWRPAFRPASASATYCRSPRGVARRTLLVLHRHLEPYRPDPIPARQAGRRRGTCSQIHYSHHVIIETCDGFSSIR